MLMKLDYDEVEEAIRNYVRDVKKIKLPDDAEVYIDGTEVTIGTPIMVKPVSIEKVVKEAAALLKERLS